MRARFIPFRAGLCLLLILLLFFSARGQKNQNDSLSINQLEKTDLIDFGVRLLKLNKTKRAAGKDQVIFSIIPIVPATTGNGSVAVSAINASFFLDHESNLSTIYFYPYLNFKGSYGAILTPYIWYGKNVWNGTGDFRAVHNGINDYGLGTSSTKDNLTKINYEQVRTYFNINRKIIDFLYAGVGYDLDSYYHVYQKDSTEGDGHFLTYPYGTGPHSVASGLAFTLLRDNRPNSINPEKGFFSLATLRINEKGMGSTTSWSSLYLETRKYISFSNERHKVLAIRTLYWSTFGDVLYFNLPATFQDFKSSAGRGYAVNRFRGRQMAYAELEYRFDISNHGFLGGVVFANAQAMSEADNKFQTIRPAAGAGLRLKFNRYSGTNIALDFAMGKDGLNFYINLGELF